jgi:hypothetical protein
LPALRQSHNQEREIFIIDLMFRLAPIANTRFAWWSPRFNPSTVQRFNAAKRYFSTA